MESSDKPQAPAPAPPERPRGDTMLPPRRRRRFAVETVFMRVVATAGIVGIGVALAAILVSSNVQGWIVGLAVSLVSVFLAATLWSSRNL